MDGRGYGLRLILCHRRENVNGQRVGLGCIDSNELDAGFHQGRNEGNVTGQPVQLGHEQLSAMDAAESQSTGQLWPVAALSLHSEDRARPSSSAHRGLAVAEFCDSK